MFVSAQAKQLELAKEFMKFAHSRQMLVMATQISSCLRPFDYEFEGDELSKCTKYAQSVIEMVSDENTDVVYAISPRNGLVEQKGKTYFSQDWFGGYPFNSFYQTTANVWNVYKATTNFTSQNWPK